MKESVCTGLLGGTGYLFTRLGVSKLDQPVNGVLLGVPTARHPP